MWSRIKGWFGGGSPEKKGLEGEGEGAAAAAAPEGKASPVKRPDKGEVVTDGKAMGFQAPRPDLADKEPAWIEAEKSPFGVRVLDVRPVTLGTLSVSRDPLMASNAVSYGGEDGRSFAAAPSVFKRRVDAALRYRSDGRVLDGAVFIPGEMEDKWALFLCAGELVFVRGWRREVFLRAPVRIEGEDVVVGPIEGAVTSEEEPEEYTVRAVDFIIRTYGLRSPWPAPLLNAGAPPKALAMQCMSVFGRHAHFASEAAPKGETPSRPLRSVTRLHLAAIRGDVDKAREALDAGVPADAADVFGFTPIHYTKEDGPILDLLLERGAALDARNDEGATLLMQATQSRRGELVRAVLARGASADLTDKRGFSALHRAAEMGEVGIVTALVAAGADPDRQAEGGFTPRVLATKRGEVAVLEALGAKGSPEA